MEQLKLRKKVLDESKKIPSKHKEFDIVGDILHKQIKVPNEVLKMGKQQKKKQQELKSIDELVIENRQVNLIFLSY